ncbi:TonB-linked SusC/RagA family outer membrane protein [Neolewinella xylanilytica]|uniref:TonB-linked SusC/RagA family outer membrane protein n=1 Tax=Neolewinella xylanilytica TaxID=1514080 RepID=A0A2S6IBB5_9BACT|nr:TonB-dependent receptor [Neolewinella xylanilytica]PPK88756.1 TonB-linked SusC/RagA family outer membrane protein [Neolewinella xylanilytica]
MQKTYSKIIFGFLVLVLGLLSTSLAAQQQVTGQVTDTEGEALIGVTIMVKGTGTGSVTDFEGLYEISAAPSDTLVFSYTGYGATEIAVGNQEVIDLEMSSEASLLDEVVVVGYGSVKRSDLTGSVASLSGEKISRTPFTNAAEAITGRLPGVNVLTTDGSPDAEVVIRVRGGGSITQDNSPLYVVDGFIVNSIRDVPPTDIESISVLKDAAATAIYGAQASNGVIVITTKRPTAGQIRVNYNGFAQAKQLPGDRRYEVLSPYEYALANYEYAALRSEADVRNFERFFGKYDDLELYREKRPTDWQEELFGDPRISQYHNLSMSGGTQTTKLSLSLTRNQDEGLMIGSGFTRNALNFKLEQDITPNLIFEAGARITNTVVDGAGTSGSAQVNIKDAVQTRPVNGVADELDIDLNEINESDDFQSFLRSLVNPTELVKQDWRERTTNDYVLNAALAWNISDNIVAKSTFTNSKTFDERLRFFGPLTGESFNNGGSMPLGEKSTFERDSYRWLNTFSYRLVSLKNQNIDFLLGHEIYSDGGDVDFIRSEDFRLSITPEELFANMTFGRTDRHETQVYTNSNRLSFFGRVNYSILDRYLITGTLRSDASSKFAEGNRVGVFPAIAVAWKLNEEAFLSDVDWLQELKLRVSYGETGNDRIDATATQFLFQGSTNRGPGFNNEDNVYYTPTGSTLYNPFIRWETTVNRNLGLDFSLFDGAIFGALDLYQNTTRDLLLRSAIPSNTGFTTQWDNIGSTSNEGVELGLTTYFVNRPDFSLSGTFNVGFNRAKVVDLGGPEERFFQSNWASTDLKDQNDYLLRVGSKLGDIYGYVSDGYYTTDDFSSYDPVANEYILKDGIANSGGTVGNTEIRPGFMKLRDLNGDGEITSEDRRVIGNALPVSQGGFGFNATFKGFDASVFFNWSLGNDVYNTGKIQYNQFRRVNYGNLLETMSIDNRFTYLDVDGSYTGTPGGIVTDLDQLAELNEGKEIWSHYSFGIAQATITDWAVEDGSFLRLNNLNIGYTLPTSLTSRVGISSLRVYVTGTNLKLWTNYTGYDPEVSTSRSSSYAALTPGVDYSSFPRNRAYTFGINLNF